MKKILALILALLMVLSLAACGRKSLSDKILDSLQDDVMEDLQNLVEDLQEYENEVSDEDDSNDSADKPKANAATAEGLLDIVDLVVADTEMYTITISDVEYDEDWEEYTLNVLLENKSDIELDFNINYASINSILADIYMSNTVAAGKKAYDEIEISLDPEDEGIYDDIGDYTDIALTFIIYDAEEWELIATESVNIYPQGEKEAVAFERKAQPDDEVIVDNEYVTVTVIGYEMSDDGDFSVKLFLVNKTDDYIYLDADDVALNDFMISAFLGADLPAGMRSYEELDWYDYELEDNHIDVVEEIELVLSASDEDWDTLFETDAITLKP